MGHRESLYFELTVFLLKVNDTVSSFGSSLKCGSTYFATFSILMADLVYSFGIGILFRGLCVMSRVYDGDKDRVDIGSGVRDKVNDLSMI